MRRRTRLNSRIANLQLTSDIFGADEFGNERGAPPGEGGIGGLS